MREQSFERAVALSASTEQAFFWHERPGAFERLSPPWEDVRVVRSDGHIRDGARVTLEVRVAGFPLRWEVLHDGYVAGERFVDTQTSGPFARWRHTHRVERAAEGARLVDHIEYALPLGALGATLGGGLVRRKLDRMFNWRHRIMADDLAAHSLAGLAPLTVAVSGATGLVGSALVPFLTTGGHSVRPLVRQPSEGDGAIAWPVPEHLASESLAGVDAVVHLAGESVAQRWTDAAKQRIRDSRVVRTRALAEAIARSATPPRVLVCASAIGIYGDAGDAELDEGSPRGDGFLADVCAEWEAACQPARDAGVRVVNLRIGVVLSPKGGALAKLLTPFKLGLGGPVGGGRQWMSWVALDDVVGAIHHALAHESLSGPVNAVSPGPVTNAEFGKILGRVLRRPAVLPAPAFALKALFGEMAGETVLAGQKVHPRRLLESGYAFRFPELESALRATLGA